MMHYELAIDGITVITVTVNSAGSGMLTSNLKEGDPVAEYNSAIDGLEALILAHACAGIDVAYPAYVSGVQTAVQEIANNFG
jgi:hypothetical protein